MRIFITLVAGLLALSAGAADEVYRWVDKDGVIHFGAQPPSKDAKPAQLPQIQTYSHRLDNKVLPLSPLEAATKPASSAVLKEVRILAPVQDEVFRDAAASVSVVVAVLPALPAGAGIVFYLDGAAKNAKPASSGSMTFNNVERGEHSVSAAVVDVSGKELMRAAPVVFHSKPPIAR